VEKTAGWTADCPSQALDSHPETREGRAMANLEDEVTQMMEADSRLLTGGSLSTGEMFVLLVGHFNKLEIAIRRIAAEIDRMREDAASAA
jgi:hypothetical protein